MSTTPHPCATLPTPPPEELPLAIASLRTTRRMRPYTVGELASHGTRTPATPLATASSSRTASAGDCVSGSPSVVRVVPIRSDSERQPIRFGLLSHVATPTVTASSNNSIRSIRIADGDDDDR